MTLSENEYRVLNVLLKDPSLSYTDIAKVLNLSVTSIRNLLFSLMDYTPTSIVEDDNTTPVNTRNGYLNPEPKKNNNLSFFAKFNYDLLDLMRFDFLISCSTLEQMQNVRTFCIAHPYTSFRGRVHGGSSGVYVIFFMPAEILDMIIYSLETLKREHYIEDYSQLIKNSNFSIFSLLKIDVFDVTQIRWNFDFDEFMEKFQKKELSEITDYFKKGKNKSILSHLDRIDAMILNEWGYGAGPRKTKAELLNNISKFPVYQDFIKDLKLNRYIISDHVDALSKENIIKNIGIGFDRRKIQILTTLFYTGKAKTEFLNSFANFIQSEEFPFESTLSVGDLDVKSQEANFTWWVNFTADIVSKFTEFLYENTTKLQTYIVADTSEIENFSLYHANFITSTPTGGHWNTSVETCLVKPLESFLNPDKIQSLDNDFQKFQNRNKL